VKIKEQKMVGLTIVDGDIIRAYDFKPMVGRDDCFIEGRVVDAHNNENGYQAYKIVVTKDHFGNDRVSTKAGPDNRVGIEMFVPWRTSFMEFQGRIINLSR
jgi:hypothetical protein